MTPHLAEQARVTVCERCFWNGANVVLRAAEPCHKCGSWAARTITIDTPPAPAPQGDAGEVAGYIVDKWLGTGGAPLMATTTTDRLRAAIAAGGTREG
jgi:hypothetical protein